MESYERRAGLLSAAGGGCLRAARVEGVVDAFLAGSSDSVTDDALINDALKGDIRAAARLMTLLEQESPQAIAAMRSIYPRSGKAHTIGVTGAPGSGKSTLVDKLAAQYRSLDRTVGIVAVDPSSPFSGGAILGDRIRMQNHFLDEGVFIRSMASRGSLGGLSKMTHRIVAAMDAMGKDVVMIETVGVGQEEVDVVGLAQTTVVVTVPGLGDDVQAAKAGIFEIADIMVVNKGDMEGADRSVTELQAYLKLAPEQPEWEVPVLKVSAKFEEGLGELVDAIERHHEYVRTGTRFQEKRRKVAQAELEQILKDALYSDVVESIGGSLKEHLDRIAAREIDPYSAAEEIMREARHGRGGP
jgi:LAO/AO transport system kinase